MADGPGTFIHAPAPAGRPTVVFIHGAGGDHTLWAHQIAALRGRFGALAVDLPGHGGSAPIGEISVPAYARWVRDLAASAGLSRPVLAGHSMGGGIALQAALDSPGFPAGLVLIGSGAKLGVSERILELIESDPEGAVRSITRFAYSDNAAEELISEGRKRLSLCPTDVLLADFRACNRFDVRERVAEIDLPALVICGEEDRLTFPKFSSWLADRLPRAELVLVPGAGHAVMLESPDAVSNALIGFLESQAR